METDIAARFGLLEIDDGTPVAPVAPAMTTETIAALPAVQDAAGHLLASIKADMAPAPVAVVPVVAEVAPDPGPVVAPGVKAEVTTLPAGWKYLPHAAYSGTCAGCQVKFAAGAPIGYNRTLGKARHTYCVTPATPVAIVTPSAPLTVAIAPTAIPTVPTEAVDTRYQLRPCAEPDKVGGYWVSRSGMGAMGAASGCVLPAKMGGFLIPGRPMGPDGFSVVYPTALEAASALTGTSLANHFIPEAGQAPALIRAASRANGKGAETPGQKKARESAERAKRAREALEGLISLSLKAKDGKYPHGCYVAWKAAGERKYQVIADCALAAGVEPPAPRSDAAIAKDAVDSLASGGSGFKIQVVIKGSCWTVYRPAAVAEVGAEVGRNQVVARLDGEALTLTGPDDMVATVRAAFDRAKADATLGSMEITGWLNSLLSTWRAVDVVYGKWLNPHCTPLWLPLASALNAAGLRVPKAPAGVQSEADVADEIAEGLAAEVATMLAKIETQRDVAKARATEAATKGKTVSGDLGGLAAINALADVEAMRGKLDTMAPLAGDMAETRAALNALQIELEALSGHGAADLSARGRHLEID